MKVIIAGSRSITDRKTVVDAVYSANYAITEVVSGGAKGVDKLGEEYAKTFPDIKLTIFPADWDKHGKSAGHIRNTQMAEYADALIAVWDGVSKGTKHMIDIATKKGLKVFVYEDNS